jgi:hypothetical protein
MRFLSGPFDLSGPFEYELDQMDRQLFGEFFVEAQ